MARATKRRKCNLPRNIQFKYIGSPSTRVLFSKATQWWTMPPAQQPNWPTLLPDSMIVAPPSPLIIPSLYFLLPSSSLTSSSRSGYMLWWPSAWAHNNAMARGKSPYVIISRRLEHQSIAYLCPSWLDLTVVAAGHCFQKIVDVLLALAGPATTKHCCC
jgi:hypothetical protein